MTNDELAPYVLPWAKEHNTDAYELTLKVANLPQAFRNYLVRLLELRWEADKEARLQLPIMGLEETGLTIKFRFPDGIEVAFQGAKVKGRTNAIKELTMPLDEWRELQLAKETFDLEYEP